MPQPRAGYCSTTDYGGDCDRGAKGGWLACNITGAAPASLRNACYEACLACPRCNFISFSEKWGDCSWHHECNLRQLRTDVKGFETMRVRRQGASQPRALAAAIHPPARLSAVPSRVRLRVLVAFSGGGLNRGVRLTGPNLQHNVLRTLRRAGMAVTVLCTGPDPSTRMDGVRSCGYAKSLLACDKYHTESDAVVTAAIAQHCGATLGGCGFIHRHFHHGHHLRGQLAQLFFEQRVSDFLRREGAAFDVAVVCRPDLFAMQPISLRDVRRAAAAADPIVFVTDVNLGLHWAGYTDGFYFGRPQHVAQLTSQLRDFAAIRAGRQAMDFEMHLKMAFAHYGLRREVTAFEFVKVRATCALSWQRFSSPTDKCNLARVQLQAEQPIATPVRPARAVRDFYLDASRFTLQAGAVLRNHAAGNCSCPDEGRGSGAAASRGDALFRSVWQRLELLQNRTSDWRTNRIVVYT